MLNALMILASLVTIEPSTVRMVVGAEAGHPVFADQGLCSEDGVSLRAGVSCGPVVCANGWRGVPEKTQCFVEPRVTWGAERLGWEGTLVCDSNDVCGYDYSSPVPVYDTEEECGE